LNGGGAIPPQGLRQRAAGLGRKVLRGLGACLEGSGVKWRRFSVWKHLRVVGSCPVNTIQVSILSGARQRIHSPTQGRTGGGEENLVAGHQRPVPPSTPSLNRGCVPWAVAAFDPSFRRAASLSRAFHFLILFSALLARSAEINSDSKPRELADLPLEALMEIEVPTVYGASKYEQRETAAPADVTVITADEIKKHGYRTLADVLQSVPGLYVTYDRNYKFLGFQGVSLGDFNSRVLVLVNGHRVNNNLTDGAYIGTAFLLDIDLVQRVEVIRGPGSALYGNNAFFGVINVITREGGQINGAEASGEYGSFETYKARMSYGKRYESGAQVLLSGTIYESAGQEQLYYPEFDTPAENNGIAEGLDGDAYRSCFGSLSYRGFTLESAFIHREKGNPTAQYVYQYGGFNDPRLQTTDERGYVSLKYQHDFPEVVEVTAQVYYDWADYAIGYPLTAYDMFMQEKDEGEWWGAELQLNKRFCERHIVTLGAEYRDNFRQERQVYQTGTTNKSGVSTNSVNYGVYLQGDFAVLTNLHFNGGVRYDQYGDFDPRFNPRLALIYNPLEKSTVKAIYGTAFRTPNFLELSDPGFQNIEPETITSYQLVFEQGIGKHLRSSVFGFYNQMDDLIIFESGRFTNFNARGKGLELALEGFWTNGLRGRLSYTLQHTENQTFDWELPDSPDQVAKFNLSVPLFKDKIFGSFEILYTSSRQTMHNTTDASGQPLTVQGQEAAGFGLVNFTLFSQNLIKNLEFSGSVYNLLNRTYEDPATRFHRQDSIPQDGRTFRVKVTYQF
jgi:outer membrane receptor for ferrienterochelin and colicins